MSTSGEPETHETEGEEDVIGAGAGNAPEEAESESED
jgi:hypothetical protein